MAGGNGAAGILLGEGGLDAWLDRVACLRAAESALREVFLERGYREVSVPAVEEVEAGLLPPGPGSAPAPGGDTAYRFLDHEGRVWALRTDVTPGLAGLLWQRDPDGPRPRRVFYVAEVYRRLPGQRGPVALVQAGAEAVGVRGAHEDAAVLSLATAALCALGLEEFQLAVGHVGFLRDFLDRAGLCEEGRDRILAALQARDYVRLRSLAASRLPAREADALARVLTWRGTPDDLLGEVLPSLGDLAGAGARGEDLRLLLEACPREGNVLVDLGLVRDRAYYTGMVFEISLPGLAQPVGGGGRYDGTLSPEPAAGFAFDLGAMMAAGPLAGALRDRVRVSAIH
ncbi:MAG: ATP phosphoribosyltransferase regulatory subunit [Bacillota bacterium]|nr:ATP phosphoribosyltransferase regulatory subunit [Bacillota bacterium]